MFVAKIVSLAYDSIMLPLLMNQYSFVVLGLVILLVIGVLSWRLAGIEYALIPITLGITALALFHTFSSTDVISTYNVEDLGESLASGRPVIVQLYSNY